MPAHPLVEVYKCGQSVRNRQLNRPARLNWRLRFDGKSFCTGPGYEYLDEAVADAHLLAGQIQNAKVTVQVQDDLPHTTEKTS